jgi:glycosyltransferase involved in cell wall biosynthesis/2-polyprenyl-3-methyl-5-hydroxy-6-metoxy-1,4-benzoquinol methylase
MAVLNMDYVTQKDHYSDGNIENKMLEMVKEGISYEDLPKEQVEFPVVYHFSDLRTNILCWYPIRKDETVLEIGAGCGAVTGMLCEKAGHVTSVELSERRASINYERNKERDNLTIMVGNLNDMVFDEEFDYVVVNGVLEYAMSFTEGETPYETFLKKMGVYLKSSGKLLIAIENKLGLKYFAGAPEDHTDLYFFGLDHYPGNKSVRTFSKAELTKLLEDSGYNHMKYYYPYPDYKFPTEIFTDDTLYKSMYGKEYPVYTEMNYQLFSEKAVTDDFIKERIMDRFVNSFLVVASKEEIIETERILYVKLNQGRKKKFRTATEIIESDGQILVRKKPICREAEPFVRSLEQIGSSRLSGSYQNLPCSCEDKGVVYPFLTGHTLQYKIKKLVREGNIAKVIEILHNFYDSYFTDRKKNPGYQSEAFIQVFGSYPGKDYYECVSPANVDLICANIFAEDDGNKIIDYEWVFPFAVPAAFIMWRMIHEMYTRMPDLASLCTEESLMDEFGIEFSDNEIFMQWTMHFVYEYVGSDPLDEYRKPRLHIDLRKEAEKETVKRRMDTKLYYDLGDGMSEDLALNQTVFLDGNRFSITFDLSELQGITGLRWNPVKGQMCVVKVEAIDCGCRAELIPWINHFKKDEQTTAFLTRDPSYFISVWNPEQIKTIKITGRLEYIELDDVERIIHEEQERQRDLQAVHARKAEQEAREAARREAERIQEQEAIAAAAVPEGKKAKLKRIIKKAIGRDEVSAAKETPVSRPGTLASCVGSADQFTYVKNDLNIAGWVFDISYKMEHPQIAFYAGEEKIGAYGYITIYRSDVAQVLNNPDAESAGFAFIAEVQSPVQLQVFFEYETEAGTGKLFLGEISPTAGMRPEDEVLIFPTEDAHSIGNIRYFMQKHVRGEEYSYPPAVLQETIDIIIPVYNGLEYFDALFSSIEKTRMSYRLIIVDDNSPDARVRAYLDSYAAGHKEVILLRNEENMGFLPSVNRAFSMAEHHVALVNTDVEVPEEWLERLMLPILTKEKVASSTPFTTCGTICSFPDFCEDNEIFEGMKLWQIDEVFAKIAPRYPVMPTGIGFCMGMNIHALREVGLLDAETFGKGYGEENDWCQRAIKAGYENVQVDNLFVYHKHGGSFTSEEKQRLLDKNLASLALKHPDYNRDTAEYCRRDPSRTVRLYAMMKLLNQNFDVRTFAAFDHNLGGGATEYLEEKKKAVLKEGNRFLTIRYDIYNSRYYLIYEYKKYYLEFYEKELDAVLEQIQRIDEIWINELVTYQDFYHVLERIARLKQEHGAHLKMLLHDFFSLCPAVNLMDDEGKYCGAACEKRCNSCIPHNRSNACLEYVSGSMWRNKWKEFLLCCDEILAFSDNTAKLFKKAYPDVYHLRVIPHKPHFLLPLDKKAKTTETFNIGLLGVLCYKKGLEVVKKMVEHIEKNHLDIRLKLIGVSDEEIDSPVFSYTGRYARQELPFLTLQEDIDMYLIPSIWPETFSYTSSEIMSMNVPLAVFPVGAPVERVKHYEKGLILSAASPAGILEEMTSFAGEKLGYDKMPVHQERILFVGEEISFASRYRVEHFREQLYYQGYASDFIQMEDRAQIDMSRYHKLVFYRCSDLEGVKSLANDARAHLLSVYYDIDDYIFDYDKIASLNFLRGSEYKTFRETTEKIHQCMDICDGYFTSTETLAEQIREEFPGKPVVINRNCASMQMQILSYEAVEEHERDSERIYIGYFSGSKTHDQDFAIVEEALQYVMKKYPQVYLKLVGVLSDKRMQGMQSRIEKLPFMEWQKLPAAAAGTDINLMPLEDSVFHCCKSENKWMEAALVKVPSIMSRNKEMEYVIEDQKTAFLCTTKEEWISALERLITDADLRKKMGENAHEAVSRRYITQNTGKEAREELLCSRNYSK